MDLIIFQKTNILCIFGSLIGNLLKPKQEKSLN